MRLWTSIPKFYYDYRFFLLFPRMNQFSLFRIFLCLSLVLACLFSGTLSWGECSNVCLPNGCKCPTGSLVGGIGSKNCTSCGYDHYCISTCLVGHWTTAWWFISPFPLMVIVLVTVFEFIIIIHMDLMFLFN